MEDSILEFLRKIAITFKVDPVSSIGHSASVNDVMKVMSGIQESFKNFIKIELLHNSYFLEEFEKDKGLLDKALKDLDFLIVDTKFSSFQSAIVPDFSSSVNGLLNYGNDWKLEKFVTYKQEVLYADVNSQDSIRKFGERYDSVERSKIFNPLFNATGDSKDYRVRLIDNGKEIHNLHKPKKLYESFYKPKKEKQISLPEKYYNVYVKVQEGREQNVTKQNIKDILYFEKLEHDTYPFKPEIIKFKKTAFVLVHKMDCKVYYEEGLYFIEYEDLEITVWGETRDEVEKAFNFTFYSLYINYAIEDDSNLTTEAIVLKTKINKLIEKVYES